MKRHYLTSSWFRPAGDPAPRAAIATLIELASDFDTMALVSVYGAAAFWARSASRARSKTCRQNSAPTALRRSSWSGAIVSRGAEQGEERGRPPRELGERPQCTPVGNAGWGATPLPTQPVTRQAPSGSIASELFFVGKAHPNPGRLGTPCRIERRRKQVPTCPIAPTRPEWPARVSGGGNDGAFRECVRRP